MSPHQPLQEAGVGLRVWLIDPDVADAGASAAELVADEESAVAVLRRLLGTREGDGGLQAFRLEQVDGIVEVRGVGHWR